MESLQEVIIVSGDHCAMYNAENGNLIRVLVKNQEIHPKTLTLIGEDYILGAMTKKPSLKVITVAKKIGNTGDFTLPGFATSFGATSCGMFCFAGIGKDLYVWKVTTGDLLAIVPSHYQDITCIKCSSDDSHVLTGGKDGHVNVWMLADLVAVNRASNQKKPRFTWSQHSAEITDIHVTSLGCFARVATVSSDMTCRLFELGSGALITTICMDVPLTAVTMDTLESFVFIGDTKGALHRINIFEKLPREMHSNEMKNSEFKIHQDKIISLHTSFEGTKLVSSSDDRSIRVWDIQSLSCIIRIEVEGKLTNAFIALKPTPLMDDSIKPLFDICYFKRNLEESREMKKTNTKTWKKTISAMLHTPSELCYNPSILHKDSVAMSKETDGSKASAPDKFDQIANGNTVNELTTINNNLYTLVTTLTLDTLPQSSDDEDMSS